MMHTLIVDDEAPARDKLRAFLGEHADVCIVGEAADGIEAANSIEQHAPDVVFLDIQMPAMSGLELAAQLQTTTAPLLVFVTAHSDHAVHAFDLNAIDYLLKPYDKERFQRTLERVRGRYANPVARLSAIETARSQAAPDRLLVPDGEKLRLVDAHSIDWLEANDNYVAIHTSRGDYQLRRTLQDLLVQLGPTRFARVHKSTAVNVASIHALHPLFKGDFEIELRCGARIRMSRRFRDGLFALIGR